MTNNQHGGRKEATGVWAWKLETLQPGENITIAYNLSGLEKGDWTETDVFYRGSQEIIGAMKMDEKIPRRDTKPRKDHARVEFKQSVKDNVEKSIDTEPAATMSEPIPPLPEPSVKPPTGQSTLFGGEQ